MVSHLGVSWRSLVYVCMVSEFMAGGDLRSFLSRRQNELSHSQNDFGRRGFSRRKVYLASQVASALSFLHTQGLVHGAMRSQNVLLDSSFNAKLTGFQGSSVRPAIDRTRPSHDNRLDSLWSAPEVLRGERSTAKTDIFSFGIVLSELDAMAPPYGYSSRFSEHGDSAELLEKIAAGHVRVHFASSRRARHNRRGSSSLEVDSRLTAAVVRLGKSCVALDAFERPSAAQVSAELQKLLQSLDPKLIRPLVNSSGFDYRSLSLRAPLVYGLRWVPAFLTVMGALRHLEPRSQSDDSDSFNLLYLIPIILGGLVLLLFVLWLYRYRRHHNKSRDLEVFDTPPITDGRHAGLETADHSPVVVSPMDPMASFSSFKDADNSTKNVWLSGSGRTINSAKSGSCRSLSASSIADYVLTTPQRDEIFHILQHDAQLATQRLAVDKIAFERVLGENSTRQSWLCQFEGEEIVVKRLNAPDKDDEVFPALWTFVHEIQLTASLEHPNIARFLGVAWGQSLRSLCFLAEYVARGDLASFLRRCRKRRLQMNQQIWIDDKLPIATGIARALLYLHTRRPKPIVYQVLRARKVAMSDRFEPKLFDLTPAAEGSPPVDQEELAAGVGNAFWTAPELLTGGSPTQASDIYAFGVLLGEIDSEAKGPYHSARDSRSGEKLRAFQVLNLVASGELRPHFAANCPTEVREIALACMRQNPMQRPTTHEVLQRLQSCGACSAA
ncbi:TKL protein kinase [Phytophthora palmivora]|uniref:TKL protein kinase n=1 Tax=Phytophthora palmivora TaxID=4796 RepID=A0A2P4XLV1_9STRA|nr:TKL protein kinase [Phytophthora palmivora]